MDELFDATPAALQSRISQRTQQKGMPLRRAHRSRRQTHSGGLNPEDFEVRTFLQGLSAKPARHTTLDFVDERIETSRTANSGTHDTVEISVSALVDLALRGRLLNNHGQKIVAAHGETRLHWQR